MLLHRSDGALLQQRVTALGNHHRIDHQLLHAPGFQAAGDPFIYVGGELASLLVLIAGLLGALVLAVTLVPWLARYLPWRARRLAELRNAHRAIRHSTLGVSTTDMERSLASRALNRLPYDELLARSPDPFGDFAAGRYDRLAAAELASVGLVPSTTETATSGIVLVGLITLGVG